MKGVLMLVMVMALGLTAAAAPKGKYDSIRLKDSATYSKVNIYRINDLEGTTPRFKLKANTVCYMEAFNRGDSIILANKIDAGDRIMFVWSGTNKTVYVKPLIPITFYIKEGNMSTSATVIPNPGEEYYIRCEAGRGFWEGTPSMKVMSNEIGKKEFRIKSSNEEE